MPVTQPDSPTLEGFGNQARALLEAFRGGSPEAAARFAAHRPQPAVGAASPKAQNSPRLGDARFVVAREHEFPNWPRLKAYIERVGSDSQLQRITKTEPDYFRDRAAGLLAVLRDGSPEVARQIRQYHPAYANSDDAAILAAPLTLDDALLVLAREHGFTSWRKLSNHLARVASGDEFEPFAAAFEAARTGDAQRLSELLRRDRSLINARGTNGNTLLNLAAACQQEPIVELLLQVGANPDIGNRYSFTPLHEAAYMNQLALAMRFVEAGASLQASGRGDGGTPLVQALFWGHREVAEWLAGRGIFPRNLRAAAGAGRLEVVRAFFDERGRLTAPAGQHRAFYRPHPGFPAWKPSDEPSEIIDEAFVYAAKRGELEVMKFLLERGARIDGEPYNGTALQWAVRNGQLDAAIWLLAQGAGVDQTGNFGGERAITPLHAAVWADQPAAVQILLRHGANSLLRDPRYHSTPTQWADHLGCHQALEVLLAGGMPLAQAAEANDLALATWLLEKGALVDPPGMPVEHSPLDLAQARGHHEMVALLRRN